MAYSFLSVIFTIHFNHLTGH